MSDSVGSALQSVLVDLIDISLQGKQAHWNIQGPRFRSLHLQLDEIVSFARTASDDVAERLSAINVAPDGRAANVAATSAATLRNQRRHGGRHLVQREGEEGESEARGERTRS